MRYSKQREAVYSVLSHTDTHPNAAWIYARAREIVPNISLGTVYRNLDELVAEGRIKRVSASGSADRYDAAVGNHAHFLCEQCGRVIDLDSPKVVLPDAPVGVTRCEITLYGICDECRSCDKNNIKE